ncbi:hypothetical protein [Pedosphaera parvula]|nr:hypothetical protein [Pedosphaera parvula]
MQNSAHPQSAPNPAGKGTESSDVGLKFVMIFMGILLASAIVIHLILGLQFRHYLHTHGQADQEAQERQVLPAVAQSRQLWPEPHLQISPTTDLEHFRDRENIELQSYGWVDKKAGIVRIPIDRAMDLLLQKGLPVRTSTNAAQTGGSNLQLIQDRRGEYVPPQGGNQ